MTRTAIALLVLTLAGVCPPAAAQPRETVTIGVVADGPLRRSGIRLDIVQSEITALLQQEFDVRMPEGKRRNGGWTLQGVRRALRDSLADAEVDIVLVLGVVASHESARMTLDKPVIAGIVVDAELQGFPIRDGASGRRNFNYLASFHSIEEELQTFRRIVDFDHVAVLVDVLAIEGIEALQTKVEALTRRLDIRMSAVAVTDSVAAVLAGLPADVQAVYVTPLLRLDESAMRELADAFVARRLPTFSLLGQDEVALGLMLTTGGSEADVTRYARRIALNIQRILLGEEPGSIEVTFAQAQRTAINMRTARAIGVLPRWSVLVDAVKFDDDEFDSGPTLSLVEAMSTAVAANLDRRAAELSVTAAGEQVAEARASLLPQLDAGTSHTRIDADRASPFLGAERQTTAGLAFSQIVYSDSARAGYQIARFLESSADFEYKAIVLDVLQDAANAYLLLLRARALEEVFASNLEVTRTNLELARLREKIGISGRGDVLRWEGQIAVDKQELLSTQADRHAAETELSRVLNRPQDQRFSMAESGVDETLALMRDPRFQRFIDNPIVWQTFLEFSVEEALRVAPELASLDAAITAQDRALLANRRSFYVPDIALVSDFDRIVERSGAGSDLTGTGLDDERWSVGLQASIPIYSGGARKSQTARARIELRQLELQRAAAAERIEARMRAALHQAGGSYPAIELARDGAVASLANLELVIDAYSKGAVSVTDLVDAQDAALSAELASAQAEFAFLIDYMEITRASGSFDALLAPASSEAWLQRLESFFRERGAAAAVD